MQKRKKEKRRKLLLIPLISSAILFITSSYAWFSANRMVTVDSLKVHVQADGGLEVSTNAIDWKQVVNVQDIIDARSKYPSSINQVPNEMSPVSTGATITNGLMEMFEGNATSNSDGDFVLVTNKSTETESFGEESSGLFIAFDVFFRVKSTKELYIDGASKIEYTSDRTPGIENATRIAFLTEGTSADTPSASQALKGASSAIIWEPNYDVHTEHGVNHARDTYGISTSQAGALKINYDGVIGEIPETSQVLVSNAKSSSYPSLFRSVDTKIATTKANTANQKIMDLNPDVTKIRIYMWIEGQDVDCEDYASYGDLSFDLTFTTNPS